jgi:hypothetical protein
MLTKDQVYQGQALQFINALLHWGKVADICQKIRTGQRLLKLWQFLEQIYGYLDVFS